VKGFEMPSASELLKKHGARAKSDVPTRRRIERRGPTRPWQENLDRFVDPEPDSKESGVSDRTGDSGEVSVLTQVSQVDGNDASLGKEKQTERRRGRTVSNLAKRTLIKPDWSPDFSKDEAFLRAHFRETFGKGKLAKEIDFYCQLYAEARRRQSVSLHFLSSELGELIGSSSNGTIRARLLSCEQLGLLVHQGFNNETKEHQRGTYVHVKFPWKNNRIPISG
jgi:hypothetical protein